jgi:hypothetical protein
LPIIVRLIVEDELGIGGRIGKMQTVFLWGKLKEKDYLEDLAIDACTRTRIVRCVLD